MKGRTALFFHSLGTDRIVSLFFVFCISIGLFFLYLPLSSHYFLGLDDPVYVVANPHVVTGLSFDNLAWAFTTFHAEFWHPLTWLSYMIDTSLFGVHPGGYLFTNLLIHILNTIILFYALRALTGDILSSAMVATFFGVHPLHVEAVAWIAERKELLSGFFFMLCLLLYPAYSRKKNLMCYITLCFFFACGIMAKPMIITLPFVLLLLDFWPLNRISPERFFIKKSLPLLVEKIPLFILSTIGAFITMIAQKQGGGIVPAGEYPFAARLANAIISYARYIKKIFYPDNLSVFYPFPDSLSMSSIILCMAFFLFITAVFILAMRRHPFLIVGWLWFTGMLFPVIGIVKIGDFAMADRFTYLPLTGIFIIIVFGARKLALRVHFGKIICAAVFLILTFLFSRATFNQIGFWKDTETLYLHALDVTQDNFFAHYGLGNLYAKSGLIDDSIYHFMQAIDIRPDKSTLWNCLGRAFIEKNLWGRAKKCFSQSISHRPNDPQGYFLMGCALTYEKTYDRAGSFFSQSIEKYLRMKGCAIDTKPLTSYQEDSVHGYLQPNLIGKVAGRSQNKTNPCGLARMISTAHGFIITGQPKKALAVYGIPQDKDKLRNMAIAGFDNWSITLMMSYSKR